jgi:DNA primase catalytic core
MSTNTDVQEIKTRADIVAVVSRYVKLKKAGRNFTGLCPFHGEKTPSFHVNPSLGIYKCFGCGVSGDVIKFVQEIEHIEFPQALEKLAGELGITLHHSDDPAVKLVARMREAYALVADLYHYILLKLPQGANALDYALNKRRLTKETLVAHKIGYAPFDKYLVQNFLKKKGFSEAEIRQAGFINERGYDKYTDRLMFPVFDTAGHVVAFSGRVIAKDDIRPKYLNSAESAIYKKRFLLFGIHSAKESIAKQDMAILSEGQLDAIVSQQHGVGNVVAPLGTGLTDTQLNLLSRYTKNIAFCFNTDPAGQKATLRGVQLALTQELSPFVIELPSDVKDIDELIQKRPDDWKDRAAHPQDFFTVQLSVLRILAKKDVKQFEQKLHEILQTTSGASELKKGIVAKQFADTLGLSEAGLLEAMQKNVPTSFIRDELKQKQGALTTSEYLLGVLLLFPLGSLLLGKPEECVLSFSTGEQQLLFTELAAFAKKHEHLVTSVLDKKTKTLSVSWESVYTRFANEVALDFSKRIAEICEEKPELAALIEQIGLSEISASITITDDVMADFFKAWTRLRRQRIALRLEVLRKKLSALEIAGEEADIPELQDEIQGLLTTLKKFEKQGR